MSLGAMAAASLIVLSPAGTASASTVQDATCSGPIIDIPGGYQVAQPFTALHSGVLVRAAPSIYNGTGIADHVFQIETATTAGPTGNVLATASLSTDAVTAQVPLQQQGTISVPFSSPAPVSAGQTYAIVYSRATNEGPAVSGIQASRCQGGPFFFNIGPGTPFRPNQEGESWAFTMYVSTDTCAGERPTIVGTSAADTLKGTRRADVILGFGGNDRISGLGGADVICGGAGSDTLTGGSGPDTLIGQAGNDKLQGNGAKDRCTGGKGGDVAACELEKSI